MKALFTQSQRKFIGFLLMELLAFIALMYGKVDGSQYVEIGKDLVYAYFIANVIEKKAHLFSTNKNVQEPPA